MTFQTGANVLAAIKAETTTGVAATATGATRIRFIGTQGVELKTTPIVSQEKTSAALTPMGRLGSKMVDGSYDSEISVGGHMTTWTEGIMRASYATSAVIGFGTMTTVALGTNTVTASAGDWIGTQGLRVGDIFTITGTTVSGDNNLRVPITAISTLTITVPAGTFTTLAATATGTITRLRKVVNGASPTRMSYTIEQYDGDTDLSELFLGCRQVGLDLSFKPNAMSTARATYLGMDRTALTTGTSPWYTTPTLTTSLSLVADDSAIYQAGVAVTTFNGIDLSFKITAKGEPVIGSRVSPDVFDNDLAVSGTITGLRSDFATLTLFDAETEFDISVILKEPISAAGAGTPPACFAVYLSRVKIASVSAPVGGGDGAKVETRTLLIGPKTVTTGYDTSVAVFSQSAA